MSVETPHLNAVDRIGQTRRRAKDTTFSGDVPRINASLFTRDQRIEMFDIAATAWATTFNPDHVRTLLSPTRPEEEGESDYRSLKALRKYGLILKTGYLFFDDRHLAPAPLHTFVCELGKLNDHFFTPERDTHKTVVRGILDGVYKADTTLDFQPATDETYRTRLEEAIQTISTGTRQAELGVREFHDVRKATRHFMNIFQLATTRDGYTSHLHMFRHLSSLSDQLGKTHDGVVQRASRGEVSYETSRVIVPPQTQATIATTLHAIGV